MSNEWKDITNRNVMKATDLEVGESVIGTVLAIEESTKYEGRSNLVMADEEGKEFLFFPAGTLNYKLKDGAFEVGKTYRITREENYKNKRGGTTTAYTIAVKLTDGAPAAASAAPAKKVRPAI